MYVTGELPRIGDLIDNLGPRHIMLLLSGVQKKLRFQSSSALEPHKTALSRENCDSP